MGDVILKTFQLGAPPWPTLDPFLFCVHHKDAYPRGNEAMGPDVSLAGRQIGSDFSGKDGFSMYHGDVVPGFPRHPHRGFETVTLARVGMLDHSDSLGATARFGRGDAQWMTAGKGIVHSEMFPLRSRDSENPAELFQIWLNLPAADKMVDPHFAMLWADTIPREITGEPGRQATIVKVAGSNEANAPTPPPHSWASRADSDVAIWTLALEAGSETTLPAANATSHRVLYLFEGRAEVSGRSVEAPTGILLEPTRQVLIRASVATEILMLQGRPIGEPVVQYGPFVMNTPGEIEAAFRDYQRTGFGGWPWEVDGPVHAREEGRFAIHADGRVDRPRLT